jgi:hypothetical protein
MSELWLKEKDGGWVHSPQVQDAYSINVDRPTHDSKCEDVG